jgi:S-adenosyl-L-methionine hydrolase (adenosine-forming)
MNHTHVALLTDYGTNDEFVGVLKSVIIDAAPHARVTDISHGVAPFDVRGGSLMLARAVQYVPKGIIIAVVDPGVGTSRRAIAVEVAGGDGVLIGPDNGLLAPAVAMAGGAERAFELSNTSLHLEAPGATFAGRDIFAPVAAFLVNGGHIEDVGAQLDVDSLMPGLVPLPSEVNDESFGAGVKCEVTWVDTFGNCQLNVGADDVAHMPSALRVVLGDEVRRASIVRTYADIQTGALGMVIDSYGMLALSMDRSSAAQSLRLGVTDEVRLFPYGDEPDPSQTTKVGIRR